MPRLPVWLVVLVGGLVVVFGVFRLTLAFRSKEDDARARERGGLIGLPRRTHGLVGVVYLIAGTLLILTALGIKLPFMR